MRDKSKSERCDSSDAQGFPKGDVGYVSTERRPPDRLKLCGHRPSPTAPAPSQGEYFLLSSPERTFPLYVPIWLFSVSDSLQNEMDVSRCIWMARTEDGRLTAICADAVHQNHQVQRVLLAVSSQVPPPERRED